MGRVLRKRFPPFLHRDRFGAAKSQEAQISVLSVYQDASPKMGLTRPTQLVADTGETSLEVQATIAEVAGIIRDKFDWGVYTGIGTLTGDGSALDFAFPANYARMALDAQLWPSNSPKRPLKHIERVNDWLGMTVQNFSGVYGCWITYGGRIHIRVAGPSDPLGNLDTVKFVFANNLQFADNGGNPTVAITADSDVFRLTPETSVGERLLKLGLIYKWKQDRGRPYAQDMSDFEDACSKLINGDRGSKIIVVGQQRYPTGFSDVALPWGIQGT